MNKHVLKIKCKLRATNTSLKYAGHVLLLGSVCGPSRVKKPGCPAGGEPPALGLARTLALGRVHLPLRKLAARRCLCAAGLDGLRAVTSRAKENKGKARPKLKFQTQIFSSKLYESERKRNTREKETSMRSNRLKRSLQKK